MAWSSGLWRRLIGICGKMTGEGLLVSVDALAGQSSSHLSLKGPVSEKPQCGHDYQVGTELLLYSGSLRKIPSSPVSCVCKTFGLDLGESDAGAKEGAA